MKIILGKFLCITALVFGMSFGLQDFSKISLFISPASFGFIIVATIGALVIGFQGYFISSITLLWKWNSRNPVVDKQVLANGIQFWKAAKRYAVVFGFVGTMIGMIFVLYEIGKDDLSGFGPAISFALITLFYGLILGYVEFDPIICLLEKQKTKLKK